MLTIKRSLRAAAARRSALAISASPSRRTGVCVVPHALATAPLRDDPHLWASSTTLTPSSHMSAARWFSSAPLTENDAATAVGTDSSATEKRPHLPALQSLCRALYQEHRTERTELSFLLAQWITTTRELLHEGSVDTGAATATATATASQRTRVEKDITRAYERGIAIALKQREFALAQALVSQLRDDLALRMSDDTYQMLIRGVVLEHMARDAPRTLHALAQPAPPSAQAPSRHHAHAHETALLELVRTEALPHHRRSRAERQRFHDEVERGVCQWLDEYVRDVPLNKQSMTPFNEALRVFASNGLSFRAMKHVLTLLPMDSQARHALTVDTFAAILQGARGSEIPRTLTLLARSSAGAALMDSRDGFAEVHMLWDVCLRAVCNTVSTTLFDRGTRVDLRHVKAMKALFHDVDTHLQRLAPLVALADPSHAQLRADVFELRVKAAAWCGVPRRVLSLLDEYKELVVDGEEDHLVRGVVLKALELYPSVGVRRVTRWDIARVLHHPTISAVPEVMEMERELEELKTTVLPRAKDAYHHARIQNNNETKAKATTPAARMVDLTRVEVEEEEEAAPDEKEKEVTESASREQVVVLRRELRRAEQNARRLQRRLATTRRNQSWHLVLQQRLEAADHGVSAILAHLPSSPRETEETEATADPRQELEVACAVMTQYMTLGNRYASRMSTVHRNAVADTVMQRVHELLELATQDDLPSTWRSLPTEQKEIQQKQVRALFAAAAKAAANFWREQDLEQILARKQRVLAMRHWEVEDYDRVVFARVARLDLEGAHTLLQDMHNHGMAPSATTLHRVVLGVLHALARPVAAPAAAQDDEDEQAEDGNEDGEEDAPVVEEPVTSTNGPHVLEDISSFLQDWHNLCGVKPMSKTVVPVLARLVATNNVAELRRLLQILEAMEGGLEPATQLWLERKLAGMGKSLDDLRL